MSNRFDGKVAVVTGGASGIGAAIVARLRDEGASVVVGDLHTDDVRCDVTVEADVEALVATAVERFGGLHLAANCAGVGTFAPIADHPVEEWDRVVDICLKGVFLAVKHEARAMRDAGGGAVVNIASIHARQPGDVAAAVCWLLSEEASWVSGDTLFVDGAALTREYPRFFDVLG